MRLRLIRQDAGKPQTVERGVHRRGGGIHHQPGRDGYRTDTARTVERPAVGDGGNGCARHQTVAAEIAWSRRHAVASDVLRSCTNDASYLPDTNRPQRGVRQLTDPDAEIEPFVHQ